MSLPSDTKRSFWIKAAEMVLVCSALPAQLGPAQVVELILVGFAGYLGLSQIPGDRHQMINCCISGLVPSQLPLRGTFQPALL